jgi:hypothetical protein
VSYAIALGHNILTPRGEEAANFIDALYKFSQERCAMGLGDQITLFLLAPLLRLTT